jgi:hypothetical protein
LPQSPSSGVASSVFPKFHPGLSPATAADAVTGVKVAVHPETSVAEATVEDDELEIWLVEELDVCTLEEVDVCKPEEVDVATIKELELEVPVPGRHWE